MYDVECKLIGQVYNSDSIGIQTSTETITTTPIIKVEDVRADEFYKASQQGLRPSLRLKISSLNYNDQTELTYMSIRYNIIRAETNIDETILVCERKSGNG